MNKKPEVLPCEEYLSACGVMIDGNLYSGYRTHQALMEAHSLEGVHEREKGYVTSTGRFVSRREACEIGIDSGQVQPGPIRDILSCDITWVD
jgi:hypothetical protein